MNGYFPIILMFLWIVGDSRAASSSLTGYPSLRSCLSTASIIDGVPEHDNVDDEVQGAELVLLTLAIPLPHLSPFTVEDGTGQAMPAFMAVQLDQGTAPLRFVVEGRMHALDIAEDPIGLPDASRGLSWATFHPNGTTGGSVVGENIAVNLGVFNPELLTERYGGEIGTTWAKSRLRDRIDAVIAHEVAEGQAGTHEGAEALAVETTLSVSEGTRRILRAMAGRGR
jgi:hypothetical protein